MLGRTPANIKPVRPKNDGENDDFDAAQNILM
jgi:actin-like ATPase involved in cell morphogenesis